MGYQGKGKINITANGELWKREYIELRAQRLRWTVSKYAGVIIDNWLNSGAPPVDRIEERLPKIPVPKPEESK